ncbi:hypothetical protein EYF80_024498 [Liparis tanakae]|uniref:Uncharacterized protein n=1 Tax=Liparis tanakae TaxID=230148 RepID=A0A4Z2HK79_9TELE|nr:hypothetical protein EYF80_024498 [Liparis tanakae]
MVLLFQPLERSRGGVLQKGSNPTLSPKEQSQGSKYPRGSGWFRPSSNEKHCRRVLSSTGEDRDLREMTSVALFSYPPVGAEPECRINRDEERARECVTTEEEGEKDEEEEEEKQSCTNLSTVDWRSSRDQSTVVRSRSGFTCSWRSGGRSRALLPVAPEASPPPLPPPPPPPPPLGADTTLLETQEVLLERRGAQENQNQD